MPLGVDSYTKLLMHCEGADAATTFRDGSPTHRTLTSSGSSAQIDTAQYKFGVASGLFSNGYVYAADSDDWHFTGDFTLDLWIRHSSLPASGSHQMYLSQYVTTKTHWNFRISNTSGNYYLRYEFVNSGSSVASFASSYITIATGAWHHIALVRNGSAWDIYYDGVDVGGGTDDDSLVNLASSLYVGSWGSGGGYYFYGWMDEVRISKGIARWTGEFTPPEEAYWLEDSITDALTTHDEAAGDETDDEVDSTVKLLLHGEGADASTTIKDSSATHRAVSVYGNAQIDTAQKKFGSASILFDGVSDAVYCADSDDWYLGTGDFTIDWWVRFSSLPANGNYAYIIGQRVNDNNRWNLLINNNSGTYRMILSVRGSQSFEISRNFSSLSTETWYHMALTRAGSSFKMFLDGNQLSTEYITGNTIDNFATVLTLGSRYSDYAWPFNGWLDEVRLIKGKAVWTAGFTPPTSAYAILDHRIEHVTTSENLITDPGLPTDADFTEIVNLSDTFDYIAGIEYFGEIDEDIALEDIVTPNVTYDYNFIDATAVFSGTVVNVSASYGKSLTEALTTADTVEGQYNVSMWGSAQFPLFETAAYTGLGFNSGDMNFPVFEGVAYAGARSSNQEHPKFGLSGTMQIQYPFGQDAIHPKFSGTAAMTVGKVVSGDANFPLFSGTGTMVGNPQLTGDIDFPVFGGNGGMSVGGRFANYVLRYVR
jgi:hypothetical protein